MFQNEDMTIISIEKAEEKLEKKPLITTTYKQKKEDVSINLENLNPYTIEMDSKIGTTPIKLGYKGKIFSLYAKISYFLLFAFCYFGSIAGPTLGTAGIIKSICEIFKINAVEELWYTICFFIVLGVNTIGSTCIAIPLVKNNAPDFKRKTEYDALKQYPLSEYVSVYKKKKAFYLTNLEDFMLDMKKLIEEIKEAITICQEALYMGNRRVVKLRLNQLNKEIYLTAAATDKAKSYMLHPFSFINNLHKTEHMEKMTQISEIQETIYKLKKTLNSLNEEAKINLSVVITNEKPEDLYKQVRKTVNKDYDLYHRKNTQNVANFFSAASSPYSTSNSPYPEHQNYQTIPHQVSPP